MTAEEFDWRFEGRRPSLPMPFLGGLALWAGCAASFSCARMLDGAACATIALAAALSACALGALSAAVYRWSAMERPMAGEGRARSVPARFIPVGLAACMGLLGCSLGFGQAALIHSAAIAYDGRQLTCQVVMLEDSSEGAYGESCLVSLELPEGKTERACARFPSGEVLLCGERATVTVALSASDIERGDYDWGRGAALTARVGECSRVPASPPYGWLLAARSSAIGAFEDGSDTGYLLQALVCGYRRGVRGTALYASFQACGLAHLIAVSGAHLVIVTSLFAAFLRALRAPRRLSISVLVCVMASYLIFSGAPVSALRATLMSSVGVMSLLARRRPSSLSALGVCLIAIICTSPPSSVSPSLALSALSTAGIVIFSPLFGALVSSTPLGKVPFLSEPLVITFAAAVLSQPLSCALFSKLPLVSPLANVACAPLFPLCCAAGLLYAVLAIAHLPLAGAFAVAANALAGLMKGVVAVLSQVPYGSVPASISMQAALVLTVAMGFLLWAGWNERLMRNAGALALVVCLGVGVSFLQAQGDRIIMLDVGQGDAFLLQSRGQTLLVDTGNQDSLLMKGLGSHGLAHLDSVLVTHADDDHCGSLDAIASAVDVDRVLVASGVLSNSSDACVRLAENAWAAARDVVELGYGDRFDVGAFSLCVVWPHELSDDAGNADSVCLLVRYDGDADGAADAVALFTGDAEGEQIQHILDERGLRGVDLLKVGHHGSRKALTVSEAEALSPRISLIGVGKGNRYGHPTAEILSMLEGVGSAVYRSDENGEAICVFTPTAISVTCEK
ncbi:MAG: DNA internalization-related competence protein ComEC/Rec2 [Coriobacteriaceae bacterium]|nr:DNA internalization-related competence protein ComEC/Rec2 [Coriobacteriaceae bacterium]